MARTVCAVGENYLPASFNGVPFHCVEATSEHGRRGAEGEFPFGENTAYADLGRRIRVYTLRAEFRDDDHVLQAAALIAVCELPGPGILIHPTRGILNAACRSIHVEDQLEDAAGITYVDMEFVEGNAWPNGLSLVGFGLGILLGTIIGASSDSFRSNYRPRSVSPARRPQVINVAQQSVGNISDSYRLAIQDENDSRKWRGYYDLEEVRNEDVLASDPPTVDDAIVMGSGAVSEEYSGKQKFNVFRGFANWAAKSTLLPGDAGRSEDAVYTHTRLVSAAYMAQASMENQYSRTDEALSDMDAIVAILNDEAINARNKCDNVLFLEIEKFKTEVQSSLYNKAYNLPRLVQYHFPASVSPLAAAYALYRDAKRHRELEQRNIVDMTGHIGPDIIASSPTTSPTVRTTPAMT